ncbi:MAG: UDP-N-acetylmuramate dehydrogenase [Cytophagaceae bacterium]|nr:UDP-N-acetylmuramate dehydrogenase [Cytophagaceae bacterium]
MINHFKLHSLKKLNTFGIDAVADDFYEYTDVSDLDSLLEEAKAIKKPVLNIGAGSNLLFLSNFNGIILHSKILGIEVVDTSPNDVTVAVGAGVIWDELVKWSVLNGLGGIENLSAIPGTVGAAPVQNIGAYGVELKDVFYKVEGRFIDTGETFSFLKDECVFGYRYSIFKGALKGKCVITQLYLKLSRRPVFNIEYGAVKDMLQQYDEISLQNIRKAVISIRDLKIPDPAVQGNGGSFFKNPVVSEKLFNKLRGTHPSMPFYSTEAKHLFKIPAGWLIEQTGWKGKSMGQAGVHSKQALILVNKGNATGLEIFRLANAIERDVFEKFGITLEKEVNVV